MNQLQVIILLTLCWTCCWAYNRYEPSYVHFELDSDEINDDDDHQSSDDNNNQGTPYGFEYDVNDGHENNFGHWQQSDGSVTTGSYRVQLPDGRTQIVTYRADENGYNAQVTYEPTAAIKPLSYRTTTTPAPPARPLYEFPGIPPYHGPNHGAYQQQQSTSSSSNSYGSVVGAARHYYETADATTTSTAPYYPSADDGSDESITAENPTRLLFRTNVEKISNLYGDISRIPLVYRSTSLDGKRSPPPSSIWSPEQQQPQGAVNISKALDTREQFQNENDKQVESQSDDSSSTHFNNVVDFDPLPFPLPVPLAFRPV